MVAGGASWNKIRGASCNSWFPLFSLIRGTNGAHGDPLALHYTAFTPKVKTKLFLSCIIPYKTKVICT